MELKLGDWGIHNYVYETTGDVGRSQEYKEKETGEGASAPLLQALQILGEGVHKDMGLTIHLQATFLLPASLGDYSPVAKAGLRHCHEPLPTPALVN